MRRPGTLAFLFVSLAGMVPVSTATEYYVRPPPQGSDAWPGTSAQPFATVERGLQAVQPGDTLYIGEGIYYEGEFYPETNASPDQPITIRNVPGENPVLDGELYRVQFVELIELDGYVFEGLTIRNYYDIGISCVHTGYVTVRRCVCHGNGSAGIAMNYASYPHAPYDAHMVVEDNVCYENGWSVGWASGIHINNKEQGGSNSAHVIRRNICYNNVDASEYHTDGNGIMFDVGGGGTCLIENNLSFNNGGAGIRAMDGRVTIINNTCFRNGWDTNNDYQPPEIELIERHTPGAVVGSVVRNNLIWARPMREFDGEFCGGTFGTEGVSVGDFVFDHNVLWSDVPAEVVIEAWMAECQKAAPVFVSTSLDNDLKMIHGAMFLDMNVADYDFQLRANSPGIDAGSTLEAPETDLDGTPRPWSAGYDVGAYEYVADGDCNGDGAVDATDWTSFLPCMVGPAVALAAACVCLDFDGDTDIDLRDAADFQRCYGP